MNCSTWFMVSFFSPGLPPPFGPVWRFGLLLLSSRFFKVQTLSFLSSGQRDKMVNMLTYLFLKNRSTSRIICDTCALRRKPLQCERKDFCRLRQKKEKKRKYNQYVHVKMRTFGKAHLFWCIDENMRQERVFGGPSGGRTDKAYYGDKYGFGKTWPCSHESHTYLLLAPHYPTTVASVPSWKDSNCFAHATTLFIINFLC